MRKHTVLTAACVAVAAFAAQAANRVIEGTATLILTNTQYVAEYRVGADADGWGTLDSVSVLAPASETGTVEVAVERMGLYVPMVSITIENDATNAVCSSASATNAPLGGRLRVQCVKESAATNEWRYVLFVDDGK